MQEVTKEEFFSAIGRLDVHPQPVGKYPYTSIFKTPLGEERGRIENGKYYLSEPLTLEGKRHEPRPL